MALVLSLSRSLNQTKAHCRPQFQRVLSIYFSFIIYRLDLRLDLTSWLETRLGLERSATRDSTRFESVRLANTSARLTNWHRRSVYHVCIHFNVFLIDRNKEEITEERLSDACVFILGGPKEKFTSSEVRQQICHQLQYNRQLPKI